MLIAPILFSCCINRQYEGRDYVDSLNSQAYIYRYSDIDSSLHFAKSAYRNSKDYDDGKAEALNNLAFVSFQQMYFDRSRHYLNHIYHESRNQIELLCADVMSMKIAQRVGEGQLFFDNRQKALKRIARIREALPSLTERQALRFHYALTELHIVSSTYYYYLGQDSASVAEMASIEEEISLAKDTLQWLNYHYMYGSGGLEDGSREEVLLKEFDHLFRTFTLSRSHHVSYFEANALQSFATMLCDDTNSELLRRNRKDAYSFMVSQHLGYEPPFEMDSIHCVSYSLAMRSLSVFRRYKDLYQTACVYRTLGEILFDAGHYEEALDKYLYALSIVDAQNARANGTVISWMSSIHERLSQAYSALDDKQKSDYHRNIYLDMLDASRQNKELDSRMTELEQEVSNVRTRLYLLLLLIVIGVVMGFLYARHVKLHTHHFLEGLLNLKDSDYYVDMLHSLKSLNDTVDEEIEMAEDESRMTQLKINENKCGNVERRAKVSMVYSIIPYLDRIIAEVDRLKCDGSDASFRLNYIDELTDEIMKINSILTDWIQVQQGKVRLHVSSFAIEKVLEIIRHSKYSFEQKGITLEIAKSDCIVKADQALTLFMINTLADNARKFTPSGGKVSVEVEEKEDYVEISISDNGVGLEKEDVETLNNSKVYDSSRLGVSKGNKGFGFGIMNCKGIVNMYRKQSSLFQVCDFGVESEPDKGSRFWFRLPRVLSLVALLLCIHFSSFASGRIYGMYDAVYSANLEGRYSDACTYGHEILADEESQRDTALLVSLHNEMAIAYLALHDWDAYRYHNSECVRLHWLYSQDKTLALYCQKMDKMRRDGTVQVVLLVLFSVFISMLFYFTFLRDRLMDHSVVSKLNANLSDSSSWLSAKVRETAESVQAKADKEEQCNLSFISNMDELRRKSMTIVSGNQQLRDLVGEMYDEVQEQLHSVKSKVAQLEDITEQKGKSRFEGERIYVMNQVLDNALSTIKHETMYYPARIQQIVRFMLKGGIQDDDVSELRELALYYRQVYTLLYEQAKCQLENSFRITAIPVSELFAVAEHRVKSFSMRSGVDVSIETVATESAIQGDRMLMHELINRIIEPSLGQCSSIRCWADDDADAISIHCCFYGISCTEETVANLFSPTSSTISYHIVKQIVREHDERFGHPGLRLMASAVDDGYEIVAGPLPAASSLPAWKAHPSDNDF